MLSKFCQANMKYNRWIYNEIIRLKNYKFTEIFSFKCHIYIESLHYHIWRAENRHVFGFLGKKTQANRNADYRVKPEAWNESKSQKCI